MAIPPKDAGNFLATHRLIPGDDVLDVPGEQVPVVGQTICEGRAVVEHILWGAIALDN